MNPSGDRRLTGRLVIKFMESIIVTGATGFVGSNLARRLVTDGYNLTVIVRPQSSLDLIKDIQDKINIFVYTGKIGELIKVFNMVRPTAVFHLASCFIAEHKSDEVTSLIESNLLFGTQVLEAAAISNVKFFINTGTHWQNYNGEKYNPVDLYAATKEAFEVVAKFYIESTYMRMLTVKLCDTYGPNDPRKKVISLFKRIARTGEQLDMSNGEQEMGLVYIDDVIEGFLIALKYVQDMRTHEQKSYIIAPHHVYTLRETAEIFELASGSVLNIKWGARAYRKREMMKISNNEENLLKTIRTVDLFDGFKKTFQINEW